MKSELDTWYNPLLKWNVLSDRTKDNIDNIYEMGRVFPDRNNVFRAFRECPYGRVRVVMIFQDPYHDGSATGIATANESNKLSPTLRNMFRELESEYGTCDVNPNLLSWCKQGVLMLNTALTVDQGSPGSHLQMWSKWTTNFIIGLSSSKTLVWVLFGKKIQEYESLISRGIVVKCVHPAAESFKPNAGFFGSNIFKNINKKLGSNIIWNEQI